jgi:hypothetical protein
LVYLSVSLKEGFSVRPSEAVRVLPEVFCGLLGLVSFLQVQVSYAFLEGVWRRPSLVEEVLSFLLEGGPVEGVLASLAEEVVLRPSLVEEEVVRRPSLVEEVVVLTSRP